MANTCQAHYLSHRDNCAGFPTCDLRRTARQGPVLDPLKGYWLRSIGIDDYLFSNVTESYQVPWSGVNVTDMLGDKDDDDLLPGSFLDFYRHNMGCGASTPVYFSATYTCGSPSPNLPPEPFSPSPPPLWPLGPRGPADAPPDYPPHPPMPLWPPLPPYESFTYVPPEDPPRPPFPPSPPPPPPPPPPAPLLSASFFYVGCLVNFCWYADAIPMKLMDSGATSLSCAAAAAAYNKSYFGTVNGAGNWQSQIDWRMHAWVNRCQ